MNQFQEHKTYKAVGSSYRTGQTYGTMGAAYTPFVAQFHRKKLSVEKMSGQTNNFGKNIQFF